MSRRRRLLMRAVRALERKRRRRARVAIYPHARVYINGELWTDVGYVRVFFERSAADVDPPPL